MIILLLGIHFTTILVSGSSLSDQVFQTPADIYSMPGQPAKITCHHTIPTYNQILWYKQSKTQLQFLGYVYYKDRYPEAGLGVKMEGVADKDQNCTLTIEGLSLNSSAVYFCAARLHNREAYFGGGTKLTVLEKDSTITPPKVEVLRPSEKECKNKRGNAEKTIVCLATGFYPDHVSVSWRVGGDDVTTGVATDNAALQGEDKYYTITSRLRVSAKEWYNPNTEFNCTVSFYDGTDTKSYSYSIFGDKAKEGVLTREKYLKIAQTAKLSYGVFIVKSMVYGVFVAFLVWKLQNSSGKRNH
ncbi:M1-specific T cell receptor beta chain-like [Epinephelus fuscoguttatus]|uniref:M1-specific T cell receptor beta chain-like n=1 Tax=Epinephelus fuscoguttatus TaxID=293821 RepID=UPI0020D0A79A|nr:M1-specific T cell receptor beta chain-like [Epinephelus fuscoguttatus]